MIKIQIFRSQARIFDFDDDVLENVFRNLYFLEPLDKQIGEEALDSADKHLLSDAPALKKAQERFFFDLAVNGGLWKLVMLVNLKERSHGVLHNFLRGDEAGDLVVFLGVEGLKEVGVD